MKELTSAKDFLKFIGGFFVAGALWLAACARVIEFKVVELR